MPTNQEEINKKIVEGLKIAFERLLVYKKQKKSVLLIMQDDKIVHTKPE